MGTGGITKTGPGLFTWNGGGGTIYSGPTIISSGGITLGADYCDLAQFGRYDRRGYVPERGQLHHHDRAP